MKKYPSAKRKNHKTGYSSVKKATKKNLNKRLAYSKYHFNPDGELLKSFKIDLTTI